MKKLKLIILTSNLLLIICLSPLAQAETLKKLKVGVLQYGTVNWALNTLKEHNLDEKYGLDMEVIGLAGKDSSHVAIQGGSVDIIVTDWIWVTRQRAEGRDYTFFPYSNAVGSVMIPGDGSIQSLEDLRNKKLGVAGGPLDKSWLLLRAYSQKLLGEDLKDIVEPQFAAPPLLNELALRGELSGAINFWHFAARLKAAGMSSMLHIPDVLEELGVTRNVPLIGWVFHESWAKDNPEIAKGFLQASRDAAALLLESDQEWERLKPVMKTDDDAIFKALRDAYRQGVPSCFGAEEVTASAKTFTIMAQLGGKKLAGQSDQLTAGTFWDGFELPSCNAAAANS